MKAAGIFCGAALAALLLVGGGTAASSGCNDPAGCVTLGPGQALEVGTLLVDSAPDMPNAVQIAVDQHGGTFAGHPIEVVRRSEGHCDDMSTINGAKQLAARPAL